MTVWSPSTVGMRLSELIAACRRFPVGRRQRITFEYVLLADVNDSVADAARLATLLSGMRGQGQRDPAERGPRAPLPSTVRSASSTASPRRSLVVG